MDATGPDGSGPSCNGSCILSHPDILSRPLSVHAIHPLPSPDGASSSFVALSISSGERTRMNADGRGFSVKKSV